MLKMPELPLRNKDSGKSFISLLPHGKQFDT